MGQALEGIRFLDLSRQLPGQYCSMLLADLGAEVTMISAPGDEYSLSIPTILRGKKSLTLNLREEEGRAILLRLLERADVLLEGFRPGTSRRMGVDYSQLKERFPRLVYCSISAFGQSGPYAGLPAYDLNCSARAGLLDLYAPGEPQVPSLYIGDMSAGMFAALGILAALQARQVTGQGQQVDISMFDGLISWLSYPADLFFQTGNLPRGGADELTGRSAGYNLYRTSDRRVLSVGAYESRSWELLCSAIGAERLLEGSYEEREKIALLEEIFGSRPLEEWERVLKDTGIPYGPVKTLDEALADPQVEARGMVVRGQGEKPLLGAPIQLSATPARIQSPPPRLGQDTDSILRDLGFAASELEELRSKNII